MKNTLRHLAIGMGAAAAAGGALADSPGRIDTMTCTRNDGYTFTDDVYAYTLQAFDTPNFLTVYLAGDKFNAWLLALFNGHRNMSQCTFSGLPGINLSSIQISNISSSGIGKNVAAAALTSDAAKQRYTVITMTFSGMGVGAGSAPQGAPVSKEAMQKALADFQARGLAIPH